MNFYENAKRLIEAGFWVFPLHPNGKLPAVPEDFAHVATRDLDKLARWAFCPVLGLEQPYNVGISCLRYGNAGEWHLVAIDVDNKGKKRGSHAVLEMEMDGKEFPPTFTQHTPSGGVHFIYRTKVRLGNSASGFPTGIDVRGVGGLVVGAGSEIDGKCYESDWCKVAEAPAWLIEACGVAPTRLDRPAIETDQPAAIKRARDYLERTVAPAEGERNQTAFIAAASVHDYGVERSGALELLQEWNEKSDCPLEREEIEKTVENAYAYSRENTGNKAPESVFSPIDAPVPGPDPARPREAKSPVEKFNEEYAFVVEDGGHHILWETTDHNGHFKTKRLPEITFHHHHLSKFQTSADGEKELITKAWMKHPNRRTYKGYCFRPGQETPPEYYNLFRGFTVDPLVAGEEPTAAARKSVQDFLDHALENVCGGDVELYRWLIGYFAHMFQRPWEKPLVALVFKGKKGVGKNALLERIGYLLGNHHLLTADRRYLMSNFNGHLENLLMFTLDEAFWSGDKKAEGVIKNLITGTKHVIERKGSETYSVENRTRVAIVGNEEWLVPATHDERRFAVFAVGDGRRKDGNFFQTMREEMERGGYRWLLRYLLDYDLTGIDVNVAPVTDALLEQKMNSNNLIHSWWVECISEEKIVESEYGEEWQTKIAKDSLRGALDRYYKRAAPGARLPALRVIFATLRQCIPNFSNGIKLARADGLRVNGYVLPTIPEARQMWETFIGHEVQW